MLTSPARMIEAARDFRAGAATIEGRNDRAELYLLAEAIKTCVAALRMAGLHGPAARMLVRELREAQRLNREEAAPLPEQIGMMRLSADDMIEHATDRLSDMPEESRS